MLFNSDERRFGGTERAESSSSHFTTTHKREDGTEYYTINIYNTSRTGFVFKWEE